jgi:peptidoglycan/xylan/chitin deacetylase (PgdA/CDA1 family)
MSLTSWTTRFSQIHRPTLRSRARHVALSAAALSAGLTGRIAAALKRPRVHFVYFHHVFEDEVEPFRGLVRTLTSVMRPIDYSEGVERVLSNRIDRPYVTFSFDDGFKNCTTASKILEEFNARACFFVCPNIIGLRNQDRIEDFCRERLHLPPVEFMNWNDLEGLMKRGHEIGNHSASHSNLNSEAKSLHAEVADSVELMRSRLGETIRHFAWPYGHFNAITRDAIDLVFASGHRSCASGQRGAHVVGAKSTDALCIRRDHVIAAWPKAHVLYLLAKSARHASAADNDWPSHLK